MRQGVEGRGRKRGRKTRPSLSEPHTAVVCLDLVEPDVYSAPSRRSRALDAEEEADTRHDGSSP